MAEITVSLPTHIIAELDRFAERHGRTRAELVTAALEEYLFSRRSRELRERMIPEAQAQGLYTDEDVIDRVS